VHDDTAVAIFVIDRGAPLYDLTLPLIDTIALIACDHHSFTKPGPDF
jgi:hypothetical protein